jgi:hypothetical protein
MEVSENLSLKNDLLDLITSDPVEEVKVNNATLGGILYITLEAKAAFEKCIEALDSLGHDWDYWKEHEAPKPDQGQEAAGGA